jgi:hypothetical protein
MRACSGTEVREFKSRQPDSETAGQEPARVRPPTCAYAPRSRIANRREGVELAAIVIVTGQRIAIGLTGEPVAAGSRSGAITHKKDQRLASSHSGTRSSNWR